MLADRARSECARSMRAVEADPPIPPPVTRWAGGWGSENRASSGRTIRAVAVLAEPPR